MSRFLLVCALTVCLRADAPPVPEPPKTDLPYLLMAQDLVPTEVFDAKEEHSNPGKKNDEITYSVPGEHSTAKTPLARPAFILKQDSLAVERLSVVAFEIRNGRRESTFSRKKAVKQFTLTATKVKEALYRLEVDQSLPPGEYALTPNGSNQVFCFGVF